MVPTGIEKFIMDSFEGCDFIFEEAVQYYGCDFKPEIVGHDLAEDCDMVTINTSDLLIEFYSSDRENPVATFDITGIKITRKN